jgi:hypothetical protein
MLVFVRQLFLDISLQTAEYVRAENGVEFIDTFLILFIQRGTIFYGFFERI